MKLRNKNVPNCTSRNSIWYWPVSLKKWWLFKRRHLPEYDLEFIMFYQKVSTELFSDKNNNKVCVSTKSREDEKTISNALSKNNRDLASALQNFSDARLIQSLIIYGKAHYEIVHHNNNTFSFEMIPERSLLNFMGRFYQYVPKKIIQQKKIARFLYIPSKKLFRVNIPLSLRRKLNKFVNILLYRKKGDLPSFSEGALDNAGAELQYLEWYKGRLAKAGKDIGWIVNKESALEYYKLMLLLRFEKFKAQLRKAIIDGINSGLNKAIHTYTKPVLSLEGFQSDSDIDVAMQHLANGDKNFQDIIAPFVP